MLKGMYNYHLVYLFVTYHFPLLVRYHFYPYKRVILFNDEEGCAKDVMGEVQTQIEAPKSQSKDDFDRRRAQTVDRMRDLVTSFSACEEPTKGQGKCEAYVRNILFISQQIISCTNTF